MPTSLGRRKGVVNATKDAVEAACVAEVEDAAPHQAAVIANDPLALAAFRVWSAWAAGIAGDAAVAEADRAAGDAVIDADGTVWDDDDDHCDYVHYRLGHFVSRDFTRRERARYSLGRHPGQAAQLGGWRRPNRRFKRRIARLVAMGAIPPSKM